MTLHLTTEPMHERPKIQQLPPGLVNRIAAGEVIERPASVVKECVENAIDAGARNVIVEIEDGGKTFIRIVDDGHGIACNELPLAFASHATSKLREDADLFAIATMGFRGEALASIGSVSFARIVSRTPESESGFELTNRGGEVSEVKACAAAPGTTIEIRDLFFNVPARRKFLKASGTESGHIADAITKIALARPEVSFKLLSGGRMSLDLPAVTEPLTRWLSAWPDNHANSRLSVSVDQAEVSLRGVIGLPELAMPHARYQFLYVNGRAVRDKSISHALKEAYRGLCEPGRNPAAILMITVPADAVDVNVHPTKSEVRFREGSRIHGLVLSSVRQVLLGNDLVPRAQPRVAFGGAPSAVADASTMRSQLASFFRADVGADVGAAGRTVVSGGAYLPEVAKSAATSSQRSGLESSSGQSAEDRIDTSLHRTNSRLREFSNDAPAAIQLHNSYLVVESAEGLSIIDQHALHERILFEELLAKVQRGPLESQRLLLPLTFRATPQQIDALERMTPIFAQLGIEAGALGPDAVGVHAFPSFLSKLDPAEFVRDVLERSQNENSTPDHEALLHETLDMMACKAAVKAGDALAPDEIAALLAKRDLIDRASNCPHGRPTTLKLSLRDLEKQFKRTGF